MLTETNYFSVTKAYFLLVPKAVIPLCSESHMKHVNRLREKGEDYFNVKAAGQTGLDTAVLCKIKKAVLLQSNDVMVRDL